MATLSDKCVEKGIKLKEVMSLSGRAQSTLNKWHNENPEFLDIVIRGCVDKRNEQREQENN